MAPMLPHGVDRTANFTSNGTQALALLVLYPDLHVSLDEGIIAAQSGHHPFVEVY
jgi:hypothetical protein